MLELAAAVVSFHLKGKTNPGAVADQLRHAGGILLHDQTPAGAYISLPPCPILDVRSLNLPRVSTGCFVQLNSVSIVDALLYRSDGRVHEIELAAALDDFPKEMTNFEIVDLPVNRSTCMCVP